MKPMFGLYGKSCQILDFGLQKILMYAPAATVWLKSTKFRRFFFLKKKLEPESLNRYVDLELVS